MMASTHMVIGTLFAAILKLIFPQAPAESLLIAGASGGSLPDLDRFSEHRKDLHFPSYGGFSLVIFVLALLFRVSHLSSTLSTILCLVSSFFVAFWLHPLFDMADSPRKRDMGEGYTVYDHLHNRWYKAWRERIRISGFWDWFIAFSSFFIMWFLLGSLLKLISFFRGELTPLECLVLVILAVLVIASVIDHYKIKEHIRRGSRKK